MVEHTLKNDEETLQDDELEILKDLVEHQNEIIENQGTVIDDLRDQWIIHYPIGNTVVGFENGEQTPIDNSELAEMLLEKLKMGKSIVVPNTWSVLQSNSVPTMEDEDTEDIEESKIESTNE